MPVMNALFGITKPDAGTIIVNGEKMEKPTPGKAIKKGIGYVTDGGPERERPGSEMSVYDNIILPSLGKLSGRIGAIHRRESMRVAEAYKEKLKIKTS